MKISNIKKYRLLKKGLTQSKLASSVGISETYLQKIEYGTHIPNVHTAIRIAEALDTDVETLFKKTHRKLLAKTDEE